MKKLFLIFWACLSFSVWSAEPLMVDSAVTVASSPAATASSATSVWPSEAARNAERQRLTLARQALESQYKQDMALCYQNFDVTSCRLKARDRRIDANAVLRQQELRFNAQERQINAEDARRALAERTSEAEQKRPKQNEQQPLPQPKTVRMPMLKRKWIMRCKAPNAVTTSKSNVKQRSTEKTPLRSCVSATKNLQHPCQCQVNDPSFA